MMDVLYCEHARSSTPTDAWPPPVPRCLPSQVDALNERIRPYLLRRQKGDVEKTLVPLEETIIWVEMTLAQKRTCVPLRPPRRAPDLRSPSYSAAPPATFKDPHGSLSLTTQLPSRPRGQPRAARGGHS